MDTYTRALTRAEDTEKTWMEGCGKYHSGAVTHMHSHATEFQSICDCLLWENADGLNLEAGTGGGRPQQLPGSLINKPAGAEGPSTALHLHQHQ